MYRQQAWLACKAEALVCASCVQVLLFTATMPQRLQAGAEQWLRRPVKIQVSMNGACISPTITQVFPAGGDMPLHGHKCATNFSICSDNPQFLIALHMTSHAGSDEFYDSAAPHCC